MNQPSRLTGHTARTPDRQTRHALAMLATLTTGRRRVVQAAAEEYLSQIDRTRLPLGWNQPITCDRYNRVDAYRMRRGHVFAQMLGIACQPSDTDLPDTARAVLAAINAPVAELTARAEITGQPAAIAFLHLLGATSTADELLRRTVATPTVHPRRLIAAGVKRGTGRLVVQVVAA